MSVFLIAEIGINHNGDLDTAKKMINGAAAAGCDAVKFQKRCVEKVYTKEDLDRPRESPWGTTNREQKLGLEFNKGEYDEIDRYCKEVGIDWFASAWDLESQDFLKQYDLKHNKIASALLTYKDLVEEIAKEGKHTFISTGMSHLEEIARVVKVFNDHSCSFTLMHCNSTYPMKNEDANLRVMGTLRNTFSADVGYSGHETGRIVSVSAVAMGATCVERHITLDKTMYGSDQPASIELDDLARLVKDIRTIELAMGSPSKRVLETEVPVRDKLRNHQWPE